MWYKSRTKARYYINAFFGLIPTYEIEFLAHIPNKADPETTSIRPSSGKRKQKRDLHDP